MTVTYKTFIVDEPINKISYSNDYGHYVDAINIKNILNKYVDNANEEYDHIFVAYKLGEDLHEEHIKTGDWIGLRRNDL